MVISRSGEGESQSVNEKGHSVNIRQSLPELPAVPATTFQGGGNFHKALGRKRMSPTLQGRLIQQEPLTSSRLALIVWPTTQ